MEQVLSHDGLEERFTLLLASGLPTPELEDVLREVQRRLGTGELAVVRRVPGADPDGAGRWEVLPWVKLALRMAARLSAHHAQPEPWSGTELELAPWRLGHTAGALLPFGCHIRASAYVAASAVLMPTAVVQAGAHVGESSLLDAHVLAGNCAYLGQRVVLQAGAIVAGHLLPELAVPNVVEDDCQLSGGSGLYDGVVLGSGSILLPGTVVSATAGVFDLGSGASLLPDEQGNLWLPRNAVLGMGSRAVGRAAPGMERNIAMIVARNDRAASKLVWYDRDPPNGG